MNLEYLESRLDNLCEEEKIIVVCLSLYYEPITLDTLLLHFGSSQLFKTGRYNDLVIRGTKFMTGLVQKELVVQKQKNYSILNPIADAICYWAIRLTAWPLYAEILKEKLDRPIGYFFSTNEKTKIFRYNIFRQDLKKLNETYSHFVQYSTEIALSVLLDQMTHKDAVSRISLLSPEIQLWIFNHTLFEMVQREFSLLPMASMLKRLDDTHTNNDDYNQLVAECAFYNGELKESKKYLDKIKEESYYEKRYQASIAIQQGNYAAAIALFPVIMKHFKKIISGQKSIYPGLHGALMTLAHFNENKRVDDKVSKMLATGLKYNELFFNLLFYAHKWQNGEKAVASSYISNHFTNDFSHNFVFLSIFQYWFAESAQRNILGEIEVRRNNFLRNSYPWFAYELTNILIKHEYKTAENKKLASELEKKSSYVSLLGIVEKEEEWMSVLKALANVGSPKGGSGAAETKKNSRLIWLINPQEQVIQPKEQLQTQKGWSTGRNVALKKLVNNELDCLTPQDQAAVKFIEKERSYYGETYEMNETEMLYELAGHPHLYLFDSPSVKIEIARAEPELIVEKKGSFFILRFNLEFDFEGITLVEETKTRYKIYRITSTLMTIKRLIESQSRFPSAAKDLLISAIENLTSNITVHTTFGLDVENIPLAEYDKRIRILLLPYQEGIKAELYVKPFGLEPPYFKPGQGGVDVFTEINGKKNRTVRNLKEEQAEAKKLLKEVNALSEMEGILDECIIEEPENCLNLLEELQALGDSIVVEWPEGAKFKLMRSVGFDSLSLSIKRTTNWFDIDGELQVNENKVIGMRQLLELLAHSKGRFIEIDNGQFLALTAELRKRLEDLRTLGQMDKSGIHVPHLAALALQDLSNKAGSLKADKQWKEWAAKLKADSNFKPAVPTTFATELREYQIEGYQWLQRLAHWGVGACLADDMGLGKTIQALAVILDRAKKGPSLVVAPASVCNNWLHEVERFAPTLNCVVFGGKERAEIIASLKPYDLLIVTYGLINTEAELISGCTFSTIVLDEAHAIKNSNTKRAKSVMTLQGEFKVITTGTPIQNHLGELWNLFNFINPGLLGSHQQFMEKFVVPIERDQESGKRSILRKLIQPFILRRTKTQVLDELPEKTEITVEIELSEDERAFYEALRRSAIEKIESIDGSVGEKNIQILAEITKLRLACCHPRLASSDSLLESSKHEIFGERITELIENNHKALVFSQFITHLSIIRKYLDSRKIKYQYLDGSTSLKDREKAIAAFQSGDGDVFLISLKAGGLGLNLTAADYVIHLDPWWNPAIEDQASDRAYRIGQKRPVTIYRLVAKNTIEEKIIKLHQHKRDLADSLLEGTDSIAKISADELLRLIRD